MGIHKTSELHQDVTRRHRNRREKLCQNAKCNFHGAGKGLVPVRSAASTLTLSAPAVLDYNSFCRQLFFLTLAPNVQSLFLNPRNFLIYQPIRLQFLAEYSKMVQVFISIVLLHFFHYQFLQNCPLFWVHKCDIGGKLGGNSIVT